ncbi:MAG: T9SS type A sorting domain-containing protein [Flavobacteriales bacterium]|nr:T9SS type A sorting domain-containing protein [Flavobacteriales bacterium]
MKRQIFLYSTLFFLLFDIPLSAQWLDWRDETESRLVLTTVATSDDEEKDISVADLNNDGWEDVIVCRKEPFSISTEGAKTDLLLMNENGVLVDRTSTFVPEFLSTETFARDLYIDDFDGDGWLDVIVANTFGQQPQYYSNQGEDVNGNWLGLVDESASRFPLLTDDTPLICAVWGGDVDGDLDEDIYLVNYKQNASGGIAKDWLLINDGNGVFSDESQARLGDLRNSAFGTSGQLVDIDGDGDQDILKVSTLYAVEPWNDNGLFVLFNEGNGYYQNWQNIAPFSPYMFEVADYDQDGKLDAFVVDDGADYLVTVDSTLVDSLIYYTITYVTNGLGGFGGNVHAADLDLDGDLDVAVSDVDVDIPPCESGRKLALLDNQNGVFMDTYSAGNYDWATNSYDLGFLDINRDGLMDFISGGCNGYAVFMNDNCDLVTNSADFDLDGLPDACDPCPTNPDPECQPDVEFPVVGLDGSVARQWNEMLLESIRRDFARPTVHARNLFHTSIGMWDAWAVYSDSACTYLLGNTVDGFTCAFEGVPQPADPDSAREVAISYMAYRLLSHRFTGSPEYDLLQQAYDAHMDSLGFDPAVISPDYTSGDPAALGNYIAQCIIDFGMQDGANEQLAYGNTVYEPVNPPMVVDLPGNDSLDDWNRWQPLTLELFIDQSGNEIPGSTPEFLSPEWGQVSPFALDDSDKQTFMRDGFDYEVYHDPGTPPLIDTTGILDSEAYKWGFMTTLLWSSHLDTTDGVMWDISPASIGNRNVLPVSPAEYPSFYNQLNGGTTSPGHTVNPSTGQAYVQNLVPRADYARVLAEFWADGPDSETPPGHWFTLMNYVSDHDSLEKRFLGTGPVLDDLEWDVKSYFALGGAMHDAAVTAWGIKGWYDYLRPISAIRAMAGKGQSTYPDSTSYHPGGIELIPGYVELIVSGDPLAGDADEHVGEIKVMAWRGHEAINNIDVDEAGVGWILAAEWEPYQRPSFVTPPFAGYISGHSTYSRAAAVVLERLTGDPFFPGGMGTFLAPEDEFLVFEDGPSVDVVLQWATYQDAADESGLSRIWGGIHPPADDIPGRKIGIEVGNDAFDKALTFFGVQDAACGSDPCADFATAPVDLTKSFQPVPYPDGVVDRVQVKWYKASPQVRYSIADSAACDIEFWPVRDLVSNTPILDGDTSLLFQRTKVGKELFKWPLKFQRPDIVPNTRYQWRVRCYCNYGDGPVTPWSDVKIFNIPDFDPETNIYTPPPGMYVDESGELKDLNGLWDWSLYPNPSVDGEFWVRADGLKVPNKTIQIRVFNINGQVLIEESVPVIRGSVLTRLQTSRQLSSGVYVVEFDTGVQRERKKLFVQ